MEIDRRSKTGLTTDLHLVIVPMEIDRRSKTGLTTDKIQETDHNKVIGLILGNVLREIERTRVQVLNREDQVEIDHLFVKEGSGLEINQMKIEERIMIRRAKVNFHFFES
jgi:hypothetical protein